ncbi:MAG: nucleotide exchange factor GrpE [Nitrospiraceae bacterium]
MDNEDNSRRINELSDEDESVAGVGEVTAESLAELTKQVAAKTEEAKAFQDKYLRLVAEMENYKRVSQREQKNSIRFGNESILKDILPTIDNLERAIKAAKASASTTAGGDALIQGVELTLKNLTESLGRHGVTPIASVGQTFDPNHHQAVAQVESDTVAAGHVVEEFQKGYLLHDRVLRAAMVSVAGS